MGGGRGALSTLPRNETCGPPLCHLYGADRRDAEEPAARQLEWRVASEQEVTTLRPVGRISAHDRRLLGAAASRCPLLGSFATWSCERQVPPCPLCSDYVAKVFFHSGPKILRA